MSMPVNGYTPTSIGYTIYASTVQGYAIVFTVDLGNNYPQYHEEIAEFVDAAAASIKAAIQTAHPTWSVSTQRDHKGYVSETI